MLLSLCLTLIFLTASRTAGEDDSPPSPCPDVFRYLYDSGQWSGFLKVPVPDQPKRMVVVASLVVVDVVLPAEHPGELQLLQDERKVKEQIWSGQANTVDYLLEFPVQSPLPVIDKIKINSNVICKGPQVKARTRTKVTFTHRLNGLRPPPSKLDGQSNMKQGRISDNQNKFKQQGSKAKDTAYQNLELLDNEAVQEVIQENDIFAKNFLQKGNVNTEQNGDREKEELDDKELDLNVDSDDIIDPEFGVSSDDEENVEGNQEEKENTFTDREHDLNVDSNDVVDPEFSTKSDDEEDAEDFANAVLDPKGDAEVLDKTPETGSQNVKTTTDPRKPDPAFNDSDYEEEDDDDVDKEEEGEKEMSVNDMNPNEDAEMVDNKISEVEVPQPKKADPKFKTELTSEEDDDFSNKELDDDDEGKMLDNEINPLGLESRYRPNPKILDPRFRSRFRGNEDLGDLP